MKQGKKKEKLFKIDLPFLDALKLALTTPLPAPKPETKATSNFYSDSNINKPENKSLT